MTLSDVLPLIRCVECGGQRVAAEAECIACLDCGARWRSVNGIFDLRPKASVPLPRMYDDPDYRQWNRLLTQAQDYLYTSSPLLAWVQNAGHRAVRAMSRRAPDALTLDMACGDGGHRPYLWRGDRTIGVDIDQPSLERHRQRYPDVVALRGDCYRLPFRDAAFERVINVYNLEHLVHLDFALEEARRVLTGEGTLLVSVPAEGGFAWGLGRRFTTARQFTSENLNYVRANAIDHCNCVWQIEKALARHFRFVDRRRFPLPIPSYHLNVVVTWMLRK